MSRRSDFYPDDNLYIPNESILWDVKVHGNDTNDNDPSLLALSTRELNVDDQFLSKTGIQNSFDLKLRPIY